MHNPFHTLNAASQSLEEIRAQRIDRTHEVDRCIEALVDHRHNVLLYGTRGTGKTFLLRLLQAKLQECDDFFPCVVNLASLPAYGGHDDASGFPRAVLLQFCASIWKELTGKSYLDLRDRLNETGQEVTFRNEAEHTVQRVYLHLMSLERTHRLALFNSVGFKVGLSGEKKEEIVSSGQESQVLPFEFAEFAHELITTALAKSGRRRVVFLCDEANHMPVFRQEQILDRYLELFSAKQVQFVFVAGFLPWQTKSYIPSCFETRFELLGFPEQRHITDLIQRAVAKSDGLRVKFSDEAVEALFEAYRGHPRNTIEACASAFSYACESSKPEVSASLVLRVCREAQERLRQEEELIRREQESVGL